MGGDVAVAVAQASMITATAKVSRIIAAGSYHFVIAVWRAKDTECGPREVLGDHH
jgi:hypothetical protein